LALLVLGTQGAKASREAERAGNGAGGSSKDVSVELGEDRIKKSEGWNIRSPHRELFNLYTVLQIFHEKI